MKQFFLSWLMALSIAANAQLNPIPNQSFETWIDYGNYEDPENWGSNNYVTAGFGVKPVESDTVAVDGDLAAKMVTKAGPDFNIPGILCSNGYFDINILRCVGGFACDYPYLYFRGFAKYNPEDADSAGVSAIMWKWNNITGKRDTVAVAVLDIGDTNNDYIYFSIPFTFISVQDPDSALIVLTSTIFAGQSPPAGSKLRIDNLSFSDLATSVPNLGNESVSIYPNPAKDVLFVQYPPSAEKLRLLVFDSFGRKMLEAPMVANEFHLQTAEFPVGQYHLQVVDEKYNRVSGSMFQVAR